MGFSFVWEPSEFVAAVQLVVVESAQIEVDFVRNSILSFIIELHLRRLRKLCFIDVDFQLGLPRIIH